jgi:hypothetical protein
MNAPDGKCIRTTGRAVDLASRSGVEWRCAVDLWNSEE